jgi:hypothetical protein
MLGLASTSGARDIDSTPPATNRSPSPATIAWHAPATAESPDAQSRLTVTPATDSGRPASSAAIRATLRLSSPAWLAAPNQTSSISPAARRPRDRLADHERRQVVGPLARERAAVPPDGRADCREDDRAAHAANASPRTRRERGARRSERLGALQQLAHGLPALVAVVARQLVDVHADEAVGELGVEPAAELERVLHRLVAVVEPGLDRVAEHVGELEQVLGAEVAPRDVRAQRQRQPGLEQPPLAQVDDLLQPSAS